jgi:hypothetical protein
VKTVASQADRDSISFLLSLFPLPSVLSGILSPLFSYIVQGEREKESQKFVFLVKVVPRECCKEIVWMSPCGWNVTAIRLTGPQHCFITRLV